MNASTSQLWGNGEMGFLTLILIALFFWLFAGGRPLFNTGRNINSIVQYARQDHQSAGRVTAVSIRGLVR